MGKGKGAVSHYIAPVKPGTIMFEIDGASDIISKEALLKAGKKLPIKVGFVDRSKVLALSCHDKQDAAIVVSYRCLRKPGVWLSS